MRQLIFNNMNYLAVLVSGVASFVVASAWYMLFFDTWSTEIGKHGVKIAQPTKQRMMTNLVVTLLGNLVIAFAVGVVVLMSNSHSLISAIKVALFAGVGFSIATIGIVYNCEGKPLKLFLIDAAYSFIGILTSSIILSLWR